MRCPGWNDLNFATNKGKAGGYCILRDADGDQAFSVWESSGNATAGKGTFTFTGGTGKYQSIRGIYPFVGVSQINWADGIVTGYATWNR